MEQYHVNTKAILKNDSNKYLFSICTLVTRKAEYNEMLASFLTKGFTNENSEFLHIDNSNHCEFDAYSGYNSFLQNANGKYIILCHQDIILHDNDIADLLKCIDEVEQKDAKWAILANAGGVNYKWIATHITEGNGTIRDEKDLPLKVQTVDENFIVVKNNANLALSSDLSGFHFYGTDLCLVAAVLGFNSYVIKFNLIHKSNGNPDASFIKLKKDIQLKYNRAFKGRFLTTTFSRLHITGSSLNYLLCQIPPIPFIIRQYYKFFTSKKQYKL